MAALSYTKGTKRAGSLRQEPVSKRPRLETVTRVFAADSNQSRLAANRKGVRNKNATMRDLLMQSRNVMLGPRQAGSRMVSAVNGSKPRDSRANDGFKSTRDIITAMEVDQDNSSRQFGSDLLKFNILNHGAEDLGLDPSLNSVIGEPSRNQITGVDDFKNATHSQEQGSPCLSIDAALLDKRPRPPETVGRTSFPTPHSPNSLKPFTDSRQPTMSLSDRGMGPATRASSHCRPTFVSLSGANKKGSTRPRESSGSPGMPTWLVQTLSGVSPRYSLAPSHSTSPLASHVDLESPNERSQVLSSHTPTTSMECMDAKFPETLFHTGKPLLDEQPPKKDVNAVFAFLPPPVSPQLNSDPSPLCTKPAQRDYATSTPPWYANSIHFLTTANAKHPKVLAPSPRNSETSLFNTSISPIALHDLPDVADFPGSLSSHFAVSPPGSADTLQSDPGSGDMGARCWDTTERIVANEHPQGFAALSIDKSTADPFGVTWASLKRSKPQKPSAQRRFFFSNSQYTKLNDQSTLSPSCSHGEKATLSSNVSSGLLECDWAPSFPNAKYPNHRHAPPPLKSQLRSSFLGAETPLVTLAAIEEATTAANNKLLPHQTPDALKDTDRSIHVRFHTPSLSSSLAYSGGPTSLLNENFDPVPRSDHFPNEIGDELPNFRNGIHFVDRQPFKLDNGVLKVDDAMPVETHIRGQGVSESAQLEVSEDAVSHGESSIASTHQMPLKFHGVAETEEGEGLCQAPDADIYGEMEMEDAEHPFHGEGEGYCAADYEDQMDEIQNDDSSDSTRSWE